MIRVQFFFNIHIPWALIWFSFSKYIKNMSFVIAIPVCFTLRITYSLPTRELFTSAAFLSICIKKYNKPPQGPCSQKVPPQNRIFFIYILLTKNVPSCETLASGDWIFFIKTFWKRLTLSNFKNNVILPIVGAIDKK